ncbi:polyisoprenoid-binding protein YceI [Mesonia hippocampi]|uniref:Polyisoprenoid-binding protein YceI n=1 Tax=Mesonia hippocampi TaxID=1628250 RepID=A0A840EPR6_9FLAO|nr:polyisoprenoid-binding protein YceI [Mesonia hippocampi]
MKMFTFKSIAIGLALLGSTSILAQDTKKINTKTSKIEWKGEKLTGSHEGTLHFKSGHLKLENNKLVGGEFIVDMKSLNVTDISGEGKQKLEGHLSSDDFFGVKNHPTAKLVITNVAEKGHNDYGVIAKLTIKGTTKTINFDIEVKANEAEAELVIDRTNYGIKYGSGSFFDNLGDKTIYDDFEIDVELKF